MRKALFKGESGFATMGLVIMTSVMMITSLTSLYVYQMNNARFQRRIKDTQKLIAVTEEASKIVRGAWDRAAGVISTTTPNYMESIASAANTNLSAMLVNGFVCVKNPDRASNAGGCSCPVPAPAPAAPDYCFASEAPQFQVNNWNFKHSEPENPLKGSCIGRFVAKLDHFFDAEAQMELKRTKVSDDLLFTKPTMIGWMLAESQALAEDPPNDTPGPTPEPTPEASPNNLVRARSNVIVPQAIVSGGGKCDGTSPHPACRNCGDNRGLPCIKLKAEVTGGGEVGQCYLLVPVGSNL
ncbi:MAG: hypothetical protein SGI74_01810 [Oligoflexia bacterium]|nr:hypothetical protein [Oligoflexia bacterium]